MLLEVFDKLHIPVAVEKLEGPAMIIIFLGIKLDTQLMILCLPQEKLNELMTLLTQWQAKKFCPKKDLLIGPQFLYRRSHHGISVWHPGLPNQTLGRWESSAYTRYIRTTPDVLRDVAKILGRDQSTS